MMYSGGGNAVAVGIVVLTVGPVLLFAVLWHAEELAGIIRDTLLRRDFIRESDEQRRIEGRILGSQSPRQQPSRDEVNQQVDEAAPHQHVSNGCFLYAVVVLGIGLTAVVYSGYAFLNAISNLQNSGTSTTGRVLDIAIFFAFSFCWMCSGLFALRMSHARSVFAFIAGLVFYLFVGSFS